MKVISDIFNKKKINYYLAIYGWVRNKRISNSGVIFLNVFDGTYVRDIQTVIYSNISNWDELKKITIGSSIYIEGILVFSHYNIDKIEILSFHVKIIGFLKDSISYPISSKKHSLVFLRKNLYLRSRTFFFSAINRIRNHLFFFINNFLYKAGYFWIPVPIITSLIPEDNVDVFNINHSNLSNNKFFKNNVCLSISGQLNLESYACSMVKVYSLGPVFRAENSDTCKHLSEFWMLEVETSFMKLKGLIIFIEKFLKFIIKNVLFYSINDIRYIDNFQNKCNLNNIKSFLSKKFIHITYYEAIDILLKTKHKFSVPVVKGKHLTDEHENYLAHIYFNNNVLAITNFPKDQKPFYMKSYDNITASVDIIFPMLGEIVGGSEREDIFEVLLENLKNKNIDINKYYDYCMLRKFGTVFHSGFGMGFERLLMFLTGVENIRDVIPFPRSKGYVEF